MKNKEELNELKKEVKSVNEKLQELTPEELEQVSGSVDSSIDVADACMVGVGRNVVTVK